MIYRMYGSTGKSVSVLGFGAMRFKNQDDVEQCAALVKASYDSGINYFDTAIGYGKSEELCGVAFKDMLKTREEKPFYVSTKTFAGDESSMRKDLETSLKRMNLDYIDFYHVWCLLSPQAWNERKKVLRAFEKAKEEGLIRHITVSSHMAGSEIGSLLEDYPFDGVLLGYSAMNFSYREAALEAASRLGKGVVVMNPLGGGIIPQFPERFSFVKSSPKETVVEGALRFLINDPRITVTLVGLSDTEQLAEAICAVDGYRPLPEPTVKRIRESVREAFNELCTGCRYCEDCPQDIPIPHYMDAYNHFMLSGKTDDLISRLNWHWGIKPENDYIAKCVKCGACDAACTQHLPIMERLQQIRAELMKSIDKNTE